MCTKCFIILIPSQFASDINVEAERGKKWSQRIALWSLNVFGRYIRETREGMKLDKEKSLQD